MSTAMMSYPTVCAKHCSVCEGMDHHWLPECNEETGEPEWQCKHCDATKEMTDDDDWD